MPQERELMAVFKDLNKNPVEGSRVVGHAFKSALVGSPEKFSNLFVGNFPNKTKNVSSDNYGDTLHKYIEEINSLGYRSPEFEQVDLITMGCSQTFGLGVCFDNIWPEKLAKKLGNVSHANLAFPGWSTTRMIDSFYKYIGRYGKPKAAAIHLPDFHRVLLPLGKATVDSRPQNGNDPSINLTDATFYIPEIYNKDGVVVALPKLAKQPYKIGEVLIPEISYHQNFMALNNFLFFCEHADIAVTVSSWSPEISDLISALNYISDDVYFNFFQNADLTNCKRHEDLRGSLIHEEFDNGTDVDKITGYSHMGAHEHMHIAEESAKLLSKQLKLTY